ncbi:MAG: hypothetical protein MUP55_01060 [Candidatus Aenigmarchaeota archaeon]|nr:hypothetical protein [Candidatus Aenigmarchaeota archaeon]
MDGQKLPAVIIRYVDDEPFEIKRNFVIYVKTPDSILFKEFEAPEYLAGIKGDFSIQKNISKLSTGRNPARTKAIEYALKRECKLKGKNLIEASNMDAFIEMEIVRAHLEKLYGISIKMEIEEIFL